MQLKATLPKEEIAKLEFQFEGRALPEDRVKSLDELVYGPLGVGSTEIAHVGYCKPVQLSSALQLHTDVIDSHSATKVTTWVKLDVLSFVSLKVVAVNLEGSELRVVN